MSWRFVTSEAVDAAAGLGVDEALMQSYSRDSQEATGPEATLRLYTYRSHCALVGRYQSLEDEVDLDFCAQHDLQVGRRPTGGGAIIMGRDQLGVAIAAASVPEEPPRESLKRYAKSVIAGLAALGIDAQFRSKNDLEVDGRKIAGLGLYLNPEGAVLFHASVLFDLDLELMLQVLRIPGAKVMDKAVARVSERVTTVSRERGEETPVLEARSLFAQAMADEAGVELLRSEPTEAEKKRADELIATRFGSDAWIRQRSPRRDARGSAVLKTPAGLLRIYAGIHGDSIKSVLVTGDFNLAPAALPRLEAALKWSRAEAEAIQETVEANLAFEDLGVEPNRVGAAIWEAAERGLALQHRGHPRRPEGSCYFPEPGQSAKEPSAEETPT